MTFIRLYQVLLILADVVKSLLFLNMGCEGSKDEIGDKGKKAFGKGMMGAAKFAAKAATNEIGDLGDMGDLGEGGELLEGAAKIAAKTAVKTAAKQIKDKDHIKSDHDKEATGNKDNSKAAAKIATNIASMAIGAAIDDLGEGGELLEGAAKIAAKTAVKTAAKQIKDKDHNKSDDDKEATGNKDNSKAAATIDTSITSMAIGAATDN